jgi:predicted ATP-binding protein involved in virulence
MKENYISKVKLEGIHKRYDLEIDFNHSLNILYGQNGTGKSTLIHIIANVSNCDFIRFAFLEFRKITVTYSNDAYVVVSQQSIDGEIVVSVETQTGAQFSFTKREAYDDIREYEDERYLREFTPELSSKIREFVKENEIRQIDTSYFPAFRTMLEAWSSQRDGRKLHASRRVREVTTKQITMFARNLFGQFLPAINYPSPIDIEFNLRDEIRDCQIRIARYESSIFSDSFVKVFSALLEGSEVDSSADELLQEISTLTAKTNTNKLGDFEENSNTYRELQSLVNKGSMHGELGSSASGALTVYRDALKERKSFQQKSFKEIDTYFDVVNSFLDKKELSYALDKNRRIPKVGLKFPDESWSSIKVMSSGERQLLTMLYAVNRMSGNSAVLIDEPEISLHIDWQEDLLEKMMEQLGERQIIVCTHSPAIAADFDEYMKEVQPIFTDISPEESSYLIDEDEDDF